MFDNITKLITLILGISVASDRLITTIKSIFPSLAAPAGTTASESASTADVQKKLWLLLISFICCLTTTELLYASKFQFPFDKNSVEQLQLIFIALMATGGSAFWTNLLGYVSALKDVTNLKAFDSRNNIIENEITKPYSDKSMHLLDAALKPVTFDIAFSGGPGTMVIKFAQTSQTLSFAGDGSQTIQLPEGQIDFTLSGGTVPGQNAKVVLTITGARASNSPIPLGPGPFSGVAETILV